MISTVELNPDRHGNLKLEPNCALRRFDKSHLILLRAEEVPRAGCNMPVMLSPIAATGQWSLSGVASLEPDGNLFIRDGKWRANFLPSEFQTWPFTLIKSEGRDNQYVIGIDEEGDMFSETEGEPLYDTHGKPSIMLNNIRSLLDNQLRADAQTLQFTRELAELNLIKSVDSQVHYQEGVVSNIKGLYTVDEDRLNMLDDGTIIDLKNKGYLPVIYAMLISIYQFNALIQLHNKAGKGKVVKVNMEVGRNAHDYR